MRSLRSNRAPGSVLIVVLLICLSLVSVTLLFGHSMLMTFRGADNDTAGRQAEAAIDGAVRYAETLLLNATSPGLLPELTTYESEAMPVGEATAWFIGQPVQFDNVATPVFGLVDEASKLNLNSATRQMLLMLPGMTEELAASIVDWRDIDQDVTDNGAEAEVYMQRRPAYACKDGPLETLEELALVNGANREILYGEDANLNGILDANEDDGAKTAPPDNSDGKLDPGVLSYLTVFSRESNKRADGTARISVETFSDELRTLLSETLTPTRATEIETQIGVGGGITSVLGFFIRSGMTADEFAKIEDAITSTSTGDFVSGRVNVNTASEAVLACVPGIGVENAAALVAARLARTSQDTNFTWVVQTLGEPAAIQAGPYITGRSYQVSADVAAVGRHGRGYRRTRFVVDTSTGTPRIIYRRDLSPLGWALGAQVRQSLLAKKEVR